MIGTNGTKLSEEWRKYKRRNPQTKLVCIDITPNQTTQMADCTDCLNIGGFSDNIFSVIADFARYNSGIHWADTINEIKL